MNKDYKKDAERLSEMAKKGPSSMQRKATIKGEMKKNSNRSVVTSENREEFMKKKLKLADEEKKIMVEDKPHAIFKSGTDEVLSHHATQAEADAAYDKLGQKQADYAVGELPEKERKKYGY